MKIQSLSIVVPSRRCMNNCAFCCVKMSDSNYINQLDGNFRFYDLYENDYKKRLEFARDNGCNTVMLTGDGEPQQNRSFLERFGSLNRSLNKPFYIIEMQTTGALINEAYLRFLRNHVGVVTISLSISCLIDDEVNKQVIGTSDKNLNLKELCALIKKYDINLRLSLNVTDQLMKTKSPSIDNIFSCCKELKADQVTFRKMFVEGSCEEAKWLENHRITNEKEWFENLKQLIKNDGRFLEVLEYGANRYSYKGMSIVIDTDCMATEAKDAVKYLILRPDCHLYTKWDDKASLVF